jgi:hypothetical protein
MSSFEGDFIGHFGLHILLEEVDSTIGEALAQGQIIPGCCVVQGGVGCEVLLADLCTMLDEIEGGLGIVGPDVVLEGGDKNNSKIITVIYKYISK